MSVISNFPAMPNRILIAAEYLLQFGEKGAEWDSVEGQLSPLRHKQEDDAPEEKSGKSMAEDVLREMDRLGMFARPDPGSIALHPDLLQAGEGQQWEGMVRDRLASALTGPERAQQCGQEEFVDALAWLLVQDPFSPLPWKGEHVSRIIDQVGEADALRTVIGNDQRFQNLVYWARWLGFAERIGRTGAAEAVVSDPTEAVARALPGVFRDARELSVQAFVQRLGAAVPVLDGGAARRALLNRLRDDYHPDEKTLSRALSLALKRLDLRGAIQLLKPSDALFWLLDLGRSTQPVSHIVYIAKESQ